MDIVAFFVRAALALVFLVAGLAKMGERHETAEMVEKFGISRSLAKPVSHSLPFVEVLVGALLLVATTAQVAAITAFMLLVAFSTLIGLNLRRGNRPNCNCFGQSSSKPIGARTLVRNGALMLVALGVVALGPGISVGYLAQHIDLSLTLGSVALLLAVILFWMALQVFTQQGRLLVRMDNLEMRLDQAIGPMRFESPATLQGLPLNSLAPDFSLRSAAGKLVHLQESLLSSGSALLLLFVDPKCGPCAALSPQVVAWQRRRVSDLRVVVITQGDQEENVEKFGDLGTQSILFQVDGQVTSQYQIQATPSATLVANDGRVSSATAAGSVAIVALLAEAERKWPSRAPSEPASDTYSKHPSGTAPLLSEDVRSTV